MRRAFERFRADHLKLSELVCSPRELVRMVDRYDAVITGSDQVWNRSYRKDLTYFLDWGAPYNGKRISYAACFGHADQPEEGLDQVAECLHNIDHLSVRNIVSHDVVQSLCGRDADIVADPTLLVDFEDVLPPVDVPHEEYIFMYTLGREISGGHEAMIREIRKACGDLPVVAVVASAHKPRRCPWADTVLYRAGPLEWAALIARSRWVYTDSFHGALFAAKFNKPLMAYYADPAIAPRLRDLETRYGITRVDDRVTPCDDVQPPDHNVKDRIAKHREDSIRFLQNALGLAASTPESSS